ncbi:hypothetical protein ACFX1T_038569 [Malus domestica]
MITLVLPIGERLGGGPNSSPGIYAFYQTEMVTNFPFIVQALFLLDQGKRFSFSRSGLGILDFIPAAFVNAFLFLGHELESHGPEVQENESLMAKNKKETEGKLHPARLYRCNPDPAG